MKKKLFFIGIVALALVLTSGTFAYTYTSQAVTMPANLADDAWTTYQVSTNQPDWNGILPQGGPGSAILVPVAPGNDTTILEQFPDPGEHWDKVDDQPSDEAATYLSTYGSGSWQGDLYEINNLTDNPDSIDNVTVYIRFTSADSWTVQGMTELFTNGQLFSGDTISTSSPNWVTISTQYDTNPETGNAWTLSEVNSLQAGVTMRGDAKFRPGYCTQVYVLVNYQMAGVAQGEVPAGNLYDITPHPAYPGDLSVKIYLTNSANLLKAYQYLNMKVTVTDSVEAGNDPGFKVLSMENGVVEFTVLGGSSSRYYVSITGGSYAFVSNEPAEWSAGYTITPEFYCEITQR